MPKVRIMVACNCKVMRGGVASILSTANFLEVVGRDGTDVLDEAFAMQPDLLVYELCPGFDMEYEVLEQIKKSCSWTKLVIFNTHPLPGRELEKYHAVCDSYLQGPLLPGFLIKALELACYTGYFLFLGYAANINPKSVPDSIIDDFKNKN